jgi:protein-S-isoprenylcysteine O-methyltransferase Ste14
LSLFWKSLVAFLALPGVVAFVVPLVIGMPAQSVSGIGVVPLLAGCLLLGWCVREFHVAGRGTLAPWSPPRNLVVSGPYQYSRNPMYVAVLLILAGWAALFQSRLLAAYACIVAVAFELRVVFGEESWLARTHGDEWIRYRAQVPRWLRVRRGGQSP